MIKVTSAIVGLALASLHLAPASAQWFRPLRDMELSGSDMELAMETAKRLYSDPTVSSGDTGEWHSSRTGARGIIVVTEVKSNPSCVSFYHQFSPREGMPARKLEFTRCRMASGEWLLTEYFVTE